MNELEHMLSEEELYTKYNSLKIQDLESAYWNLVSELEGEVTTEVEYIVSVIQNKRQDYLKYLIQKDYELNAMLTAKKDHVKSLQAQVKAIQSQIDKSKEWANVIMSNLHIDKFDCEVGKISFRKSTKVEITNLDLIPKEFLTEKVTVTADKTKIKERLKVDDMLGAELITNKNITIK